MSSTEVVVVVVFAYIGYLIVNAFLSWKAKKSEAKYNPHANTKSSSESQTHNSRDYQQEPKEHEGDISSNWFHILEVQRAANLEIITSAYKRKISQYHPDKVANLGSELKELAELKSKQINAAYNYAKKIRG